MRHLTKLKLAFAAIVLALITALVAASFHISGSIYFSSEYSLMQLRAAYYQAKYSFEPASESGTLDGLAVLVYHGILDSSDGFSLDRRSFENQLVALKRQGYQTITMEQFELFMEKNITLPEKSFLLTFDDGRRDSYYGSEPLLKALNYTAVMFVITGRFDDAPFHLSEKELHEMLASKRWDLQSHSRNGHVNIPVSVNESAPFFGNKLFLNGTVESDEQYSLRVEKDLRNSKKDLEESFGIKISSFAFPYGAYGQLSNYGQADIILLNLTSKYYSYAFHQADPNKDPFNHPGAFMIKRIYVDPEWSGEDLISVMEPKQAPKEIRYASLFSS